MSMQYLEEITKRMASLILNAGEYGCEEICRDIKNLSRVDFDVLLGMTIPGVKISGATLIVGSGIEQEIVESSDIEVKEVCEGANIVKRWQDGGYPGVDLSHINLQALICLCRCISSFGMRLEN